MNRQEFEKFAYDSYGTTGENLWVRHPEFAVFRHADNKKWYACVMRIDRRLLGLDGNGKIDVVNLKNDPLSVELLYSENGIFPAYHMNKTHWLTVALDGSAQDNLVKMLVCRSFELTAPKKR